MNKVLTGEEIDKFRSAMLYELAVYGCPQQLGATVPYRPDP